MTTPDERAFITFPQGKIRDDMLAMFRNGLRLLMNPDTGELFTEDEIRLATQPGSRIYIRANAIDMLGQSIQQRARFTAQQTDPRRASSSWLRGMHGEIWLPDGPLGVERSSGPVSWGAPTGSIFVGSTTPGDQAAFTARDPAGNLYQAFETVVAVNNVAELTLMAVDGGDFNPDDGAIFAAGSNTPLNAETTGTATDDFSGGFAAENDADFLSRLLDVIRFRPSSGNAPQFRAWARAASNAIENAFVYSTALNANSVIVAITQKRGDATGPDARIASDTVLLAARNFLTPPNSSVVPSRPFVLVHRCVSDPVSLSMTLGMRKGTSGGWFDSIPWPAPLDPDIEDPLTSFSRILAVTNQTQFTISSGETDLIPNDGSSTLTGDDAPSVMVWDSEESAFEALQVTSIESLGSNQYEVVLSQAPEKTLAVNDVISPYTELAFDANDDQGAIPLAAQSYFDSLGPGELVDLDNDPRGGWAYRWPEPSDEAPSEAGQAIGTNFFDSLGAALSSATVIFQSHSVPVVPTDLATLGPSLLTLGDFGVYSA